MEEFRARWIIAIDSTLPITYFYGCIEAKSLSFYLYQPHNLLIDAALMEEKQLNG